MQKGILPKYCFFAVVSFNIVIILFKVFAYFGTHSVAVLSSLTDSTLDLLLSTINAVIFIYAVKPKDDDHKFGHTAIEDIASLLQILLIAIFSVTVFYNTILMGNAQYHFSWANCLLMLCNVVPLGCIIGIQMYGNKNINSTIMKADLLHYSTDFISLAGVLAAMILTHITGIIWLDVLCGVVIISLILYSCFGGVVQAFNNIMAKEVEQPVLNSIIEIINLQNAVISYKNLRTRRAGYMCFINVDIILTHNISLHKAHEIAHEIEDRIKEKIPFSDIVIHMEPQQL